MIVFIIVVNALEANRLQPPRPSTSRPPPAHLPPTSPHLFLTSSPPPFYTSLLPTSCFHPQTYGEWAWLAAVLFGSSAALLFLCCYLAFSSGLDAWWGRVRPWGRVTQTVPCRILMRLTRWHIDCICWSPCAEPEAESSVEGSQELPVVGGSWV